MTAEWHKVEKQNLERFSVVTKPALAKLPHTTTVTTVRTDGTYHNMWRAKGPEGGVRW